MALFIKTIPRIDPSKPEEAIKKLTDHIIYMQEQLEFVLMNLDSQNIVEIEESKIIKNDSSLVIDGGEW